MSSSAASETIQTPARRRPRAGVMTLGISTIYLNLIVLIPITTVITSAFNDD